MASGPYRLITRSDFDGLVCAVLLIDQGLVNDIKFVHPKDMQDGLIPVGDTDITANLPFQPGVHLAFDHHSSETVRNAKHDNYILNPTAPSAARVVYEYYGGKKGFPNISEEMLLAVDKADSAQFKLEEVLNPEKWALLNFIMDARTGLGRFKNFRISNYQLMMDLIVYCKDHSIDQILKLPDVKERVDLYTSHQNLYREQVGKCARTEGNVLVMDLTGEDLIYAGNRFVKYALFPTTNISVTRLWGYQKQNTVFTVGKSIFNRTSNKDIGALMLSYGGGGHVAAGTCQVDTEAADRILQEIITALRD